MSKLNLIIELGSSNTVIYKIGNGIVLKEPSLVAMKVGKTTAFEVGNKAKKMLGKTDENIRIFSPIQNGIIKNEQGAVAMLKHFLNKIIETSFSPKISVIFCVSNGLTETELNSFKNVAYGCKISEIAFLNSSISALMGAGVTVDKPNAIISLNIGGGTTDVAVISMGQIIDGFSINFGGIDMDNAIREYVKNVYNLIISENTAEKLKIECGSLYSLDTTNLEIGGIDVMSKTPQSEVVSAKDVLLAIEHFFKNIVEAVEHLLHSCSPEVISDISNNGIVVTGGVAKIVGLENFLRKKLNLSVFIPEQPENCVIIGGGAFFNTQKK